MSRQRTTIDFWEMESNYGYGWNVECTEFTKLEAIAQLRCYRDNTNGSHRLRKRRKRRADCDDTELSCFDNRFSSRWYLELDAKRRERWEQQRRRRTRERRRREQLEQQPVVPSVFNVLRVFAPCC